MADWWRVDVNGAEVARGTRAQVAEQLTDYLAACIAARPTDPLGFQIRVTAARTAHVPRRQRVVGPALEQQVEEELRYGSTRRYSR
jgi:hypothetical protein